MAEGFWDNLLKETRDLFDRPRPPSVPRPLTDEDHSAWEEAGTIRNMQPPPIRSIQDARIAVSLTNPVRWRYLQRDFKWAQKQMKKLGLNPEDARWIL